MADILFSIPRNLLEKNTSIYFYLSIKLLSILNIRHFYKQFFHIKSSINFKNYNFETKSCLISLTELPSSVIILKLLKMHFHYKFFIIQK